MILYKSIVQQNSKGFTETPGNPPLCPRMLLLIERTRTHGEVTLAGMEDTYVSKQMKLCMYMQEMKPKVTR